jgi:pilus assembly protein Flp/PilA
MYRQKPNTKSTRNPEYGGQACTADFRVIKTKHLPEVIDMNAIKRFMKEEEGLTTVEYAIAGSLVGLAVVTAFTDLGLAVETSINSITDVIAPAAVL